jgi:hypothetical protein
VDRMLVPQYGDHWQDLLNTLSFHDGYQLGEMSDYQLCPLVKTYRHFREHSAHRQGSKKSF